MAEGASRDRPGAFFAPSPRTEGTNPPRNVALPPQAPDEGVELDVASRWPCLDGGERIGLSYWPTYVLPVVSLERCSEVAPHEVKFPLEHRLGRVSLPQGRGTSLAAHRKLRTIGG